MFEKHYNTIQNFLLIIMIICFLISIAVQCSKVFKPTKVQSTEFRIINDEDGKEMQKVKKKIYSDPEVQKVSYKDLLLEELEKDIIHSKKMLPYLSGHVYDSYRIWIIQKEERLKFLKEESNNDKKN